MATINSSGTSFPVTVSQGGTGNSSVTAYALVCGGTSSTAPLQVVSGLGTSGQVLTSQGASALPQWADAAAGGLTYNVVTSGSTASVNNAYISNTSSSITITLPSTAAVGDIVAIGAYSTGTVVLGQPSGTSVRFGNQVTTTGTGGTLTSTAQGDYLQVVCVVANSGWMVSGIAQGNWTVA